MSALGLEPGSVFAGDYRIVRPLSSGGMGAVYVAVQVSTARERALKIMLKELSGNEDLKRRFAQEAQIGAHIESEHVVEVVGAGIEPKTGAPWLAMELLQGRDLGSYLMGSGPLAPHLVHELFEQLVHAVGAAHDKGIVHRDLKPENIFLAQSRRAGASFILKVLDFGIAKLVSQARTSSTGAMGTPLWMAPEQTQPGTTILPAADVWAMGLIAFRALTGEIFWRSGLDANSSAMMILREVVMEPIPTASKRNHDLGGATLPVGFDAWFARCLERDPADRFPDARAMWLALRSVLMGSANRTVAAMPAEEAMAPISDGTSDREPKTSAPEPASSAPEPKTSAPEPKTSAPVPAVVAREPSAPPPAPAAQAPAAPLPPSVTPVTASPRIQNYTTTPLRPDLPVSSPLPAHVSRVGASTPPASMRDEPSDDTYAPARSDAQPNPATFTSGNVAMISPEGARSSGGAPWAIIGVSAAIVGAAALIAFYVTRPPAEEAASSQEDEETAESASPTTARLNDRRRNRANREQRAARAETRLMFKLDVKGKLSPEVVRLVLARGNGVKQCYQSALLAFPNLLAREDVEFTVKADGTVSEPTSNLRDVVPASARLVADGVQVDKALENCVASATAREQPFPRPESGDATIKVTWLLGYTEDGATIVGEPTP